jgi:hypothetical protein
MDEKTKMWDLHVRVPTSLLTPLIELLEGSGCLVKWDEAKEQVERHKPKKRRSPVRDPNKGLSAMDACLLALYQCKQENGGGVYVHDVSKSMQKRGFSPNSCSGALSRGKDVEGTVKRVGQSLWGLTGPGLEQAKLIAERDTALRNAAKEA